MTRPTIFVVDDEEDVANLIAKRLKAWGYDPICFFEGKGVVEAIQSRQPDLVLLDIRLPDISGMEIYGQLKQNGKCQKIPIVFFSAHSEEESYCLNELGAAGFVKKPYDPQDLKNLLTKLVTQNGN